MVSARNWRNFLISAVSAADVNSAREAHGHPLLAFSRTTFGRVAFRASAKRMKAGKLSLNGPRTPLGYQMKWPIPSDAKFSLAFQEVSPAIVPAHSFCHTFFPIRRASALESFTCAA